MTNTSVNEQMRAMLGKTSITPPAPVSPQEGATAPQHGPEGGVTQQMRNLLHRDQQRARGSLPDAGAVAFAVAARKAGAKNPAELYAAHGGRVIVDLNGEVHGDIDALVAEIRRERPSDFMRFSIDAGAGQGDATGDATTPNPARGSDLARTALDIRRRYRDQ